MENLHNNQEDELWLIAKRRAKFKKELITYILVNSFLWCVYLITNGHSRIPWPLWVMLGWGIGLALKYVEAYHGKSWFSTEQEYEKLKNSGK